MRPCYGCGKKPLGPRQKVFCSPACAITYARDMTDGVTYCGKHKRWVEVDMGESECHKCEQEYEDLEEDGRRWLSRIAKREKRA